MLGKYMEAGTHATGRALPIIHNPSIRLSALLALGDTPEVFTLILGVYLR